MTALDAVDGSSADTYVPEQRSLRVTRFRGARHATVATIGLNIAKSSFQVHGIDAEGKVIDAAQCPLRLRRCTR
jgi:hypothetical protein